MPRLRRVSGAEAIRALERLGFVQIRQRGSHVVLKKQTSEGERGCVVPRHRELASWSHTRRVHGEPVATDRTSCGAEMEDRLDRLFQEWHRLGGALLPADVDTTLPTRSPEEVIAESTAHCRESGRLTWVVLVALSRWLTCEDFCCIIIK